LRQRVQNEGGSTVIDAKSLENELYDFGIYEAWQFIRNTEKTIVIVAYSMNVINELISTMNLEHEEWKKALFSELFEQEGAVKSVSVTTENLPTKKVTVVSSQVSAPFLLDKLTKDFFQYVRNVFDSISQIANVALLGVKAKKPDSVDFPAMVRVFNQPTYSQDFPLISAWYNSIDGSGEFKYIDAFNNRTKHTYDVYLKISMALFGGENKAEINPFFRKDTPHGAKDISGYLNNIYNFVVDSYHRFVDELRKEYVKKTYIINRYNKLMAYQQRMNSDPGSNYSMVFIETKLDISAMPDEIGVLLLNRLSDGEICCMNCSINTIYVKKEGTDREYIGRYVANEPIGDDTLFKYRKYEKVCPTANELPLEYQAMLLWKENPVFYKSNHFIGFTTVSNDNQFLARIQLPI